MASKSRSQTATMTGGRSKRAAARAAREKQKRQRRIIYTVIGIVVVVSIGALLVRAIATPKPGEAVANMGNAHIDESQVGTMSYNSTPPTSGPHIGRIAAWGVHTEPVPNELQVHNLEDGGVMVQYDCPDGCEDLVTQLAEVVSQYRDQVILAPYPGMDATIALTAWNRIDKLDSFDRDRIDAFIKAYRGIDHHAAGQG